MNPSLAVVVLTYNEERNLPECLESLKPLGAPVFVVDSGSTDRTVEIARAYGAEVAVHEFENYAAQRNWAQNALPWRVEWVFHLDADERLTPELAHDIRAALKGADPGVDGFLAKRRTVFMGRWIRHGGHYPVFHLRLFRLAKGRCENRLYDQHFLVDGATHALEHDFIDVVASGLHTWTARHARWAEQEAIEMSETMREGEGQVRPRLFGNPIARRRWLRNRLYARCPLFVRPLAYWLYRYLFRLGFLDGTQGLVFHFLQGFWFRFLVDSMVFERCERNR